jgi:hypothetical protein
MNHRKLPQQEMEMNRFLGVVAAAVSAAFLIPEHAAAHSWYPQSCCSGQDCEPIPIDGIVDTGNGYHVTYLSPRFGPIDEFVPRDKARHSEDGGFHGCWRVNKISPRTICFFAPVNT